MNDIAVRKQLEEDLTKLKQEELAIDSQINDFFSNLTGSSMISSHNNSKNQTNAKKFHIPPLMVSVKKLEDFAPCYEAITQDSNRLVNQIGECRILSDKMSKIVRTLDYLQIRAQQSLACTEDIMNLKESKVKLQTAISEKNLVLAVSYIKQVHDIDYEAAKASDDFGALQQLERELKVIVKEEFNKSIEQSNIDAVMSLCPLLQPLGLEVEARDIFLEFMENNIFIAVNADIVPEGTAPDSPNSFAQSLSNLFNSTYLIFQQYLPIVIQGMENSLGDIYFIRRLHSKCEKQSGILLKRYVKFRNLKSIVTNLTETAASKNSRGPSQSTLTSSVLPSNAEMHVILDELTLMIQYCSMYTKYLNQLCEGAEKRIRSSGARPDHSQPRLQTPGLTVTPTPIAEELIVFKERTEFSQIVDELMNRYYMEAELYLMQQSVRKTVEKLNQLYDLNLTIAKIGGHGLDECFYVLRRCGQRALMTNNIHAACAVLRIITDLISTELTQSVSRVLDKSSDKAIFIINDHINKYIRTITSMTQSSNGHSYSQSTSAIIGTDFYQNLNSVANVSTNTIQSLKSALSIASSLTTNTQQHKSLNTDNDDDCDDEDDDIAEPDVWGVAKFMKLFELAEVSVRYVDQLAKEISNAGEAVFGTTTSFANVTPVRSDGKTLKPTSYSNSSATNLTPKTGSATTEAEKLRLCREEFESTKFQFAQALKLRIEKIGGIASAALKEVISSVLSRSGVHGGVKFDLPDDAFESQTAVAYLPKSFVTPIEVIINICTSHMSDFCKDIVISMLSETFCEAIEHLITQTSFRYSGALKFEEVTRSVISLLSKQSSISIRTKFTRLREILTVLTFDFSSSSNNAMTENYSQLTNNEVLAFIANRQDSGQV